MATVAGSLRRSSHGSKRYVYIKIDRQAIKRSHLVFLFGFGRWPENQVDHINGNSVDDRFCNLRDATATQNAWNHKRRSKRSDLPMGVRRLQSGRFHARIACNKQTFVFGPFSTATEAHVTYLMKRKEFFGDYA